MLRTIFAVGLMAILGLIALKFIFGIFGFLFAVLFVLLVLAIKIAVIGFLVYLVIRVLSPETDVFLQRYVLGWTTAIERHALSIDPTATTRAPQPRIPCWSGDVPSHQNAERKRNGSSHPASECSPDTR